MGKENIEEAVTITFFPTGNFLHFTRGLSFVNVLVAEFLFNLDFLTGYFFLCSNTGVDFINHESLIYGHMFGI